jgi:hypothetical protein
MKEIKLEIRYDEEMEVVHIEDYYFNSCSYMNIKTLSQISECVKDFIKSYYEGK